jgi:uncharacterized protein YbjT (DUF2867 family)
MGRVLVTGSSGNVGREVLSGLASRSIETLALVRTRGGGADPASEVRGDLTDAASMVPALHDVSSVFLIWPRLSTDGAAELIAALAARERRIVYLSSVGVIEGAAVQTDPINQVHADVEAMLVSSGLDVTVLRASTLASNARGWATQIRQTGIVRGPSFPAAAIVHERDVADVVARVIVEDGHEGQAYALTGPDLLTRPDQVDAIGRAVGRPLRYAAVTTDDARRQMLADGRPPELVAALLASADNRPDTAVVTSAVEDLTGHPARSFDEWAAENAAAFRAEASSA